MNDQAISRRALSAKAGAYLQLMRFPNIFTAVADVLAGSMIVAGTGVDPGSVSFLGLASALLYGAGCVLNDFFDRELDRRERPFRPIPSGSVSATEAFLLASLLFAFGLAFAAAAGAGSFRTALVLASLIVSYDAVFRKIDLFGPMNMAACRAANLLLGMSSAVEISRLQMVFPMLSLAYVFALTALSRTEVGGGLKQKGRIAVGFSAVILVPAALVLNERILADCFIFLVLLALVAGPPVAGAFTRPTPAAVGKAVKHLVLGIPLLNAAYVAGTQGWVPGIPVALCLIPAVYFSRSFRVN